VEDGLLVEVLGWDGHLDDLLEDLLPELLGGDVFAVLGADDNGVDPLGNHRTTVVLVLNRDLGLGVGSQPREGSIPSSGRHCAVELVCQ
jgi:hypothetical protein